MVSISLYKILHNLNLSEIFNKSSLRLSHLELRQLSQATTGCL